MMGGLSVFVALLIMFMWLGPVWRRKVAGMGFFTDIGVHIILQLLLGGASDGRMALLFGGVLFNLALVVYRKLRGYSTYTDGQWINHSGLFNRAQPRPAERSGPAQ